MGRLITESGTSLAIVAANLSEITYFPFNVRVESLVVDTYINTSVIATRALSADRVVGKWEGDILDSYQLNVEGIDIKSTNIPPNKFLKTDGTGEVTWGIVDVNNITGDLIVQGNINATGNLNANDIDASNAILSGGTNINDLFGPGGSLSSIDGGGSANTIAKFSDTNTITDSNISDNGSTVTIATDIESGNLLNITNDGTSCFYVAYDGSTTIQGNLSVHGDMHYLDTAVTVTSALSVINSGTGPALTIEQKGTDEPIAHFIDKEGGEIMFADTGDVGIGITTPGEKVTVAGGISASEGLSAGKCSYFEGSVGINAAFNEDGAGLAPLVVRTTTNCTEAIRIGNACGGCGSVKGKTLIGIHAWDTGTYPMTYIGAEEKDSADYKGDLFFSTRGAYSDSAPTERMRIDYDGCVGIGTADPGATLHVCATDPRVRVDATAGNHPGFEISEAGSRCWLMYNQPGNSDALTFKSSADRVVITQAGNVGIGTISPGQELTVVGTISAQLGMITPAVCGTTSVYSPSICGTCNVCSPQICGTTKVQGPAVCGTTSVCGPSICGTCNVCSPQICGTTWVCSPAVCGTTSVCGPSICGTCNVCSPQICGTTKVQGPAVCGTTAVYSPQICGTTKVQGPAVCGTCSVCGPLISDGCSCMQCGDIVAGGSICACSGMVYGCSVCSCGDITAGGSICTCNGMVYGCSVCGCGSVAGCCGNFCTLCKGSGSFHIKHPLESKKDTHKLVHSFIEGPRADNIYSGSVNLTSGNATVNIDNCAGMSEGTFVALNRGIRIFTNNESNWDPVKGSVSGNVLTVESCVSDSTADVSWMVIGERQDSYMYSSKNPLTDSEGRVIVEPVIPSE